MQNICIRLFRKNGEQATFDLMRLLYEEQAEDIIRQVKGESRIMMYCILSAKLISISLVQQIFTM